jgi:elongator complex protein 4
MNNSSGLRLQSSHHNALMSFRKRNVGLSSGSPRNADTPLKSVVTALPGVRPSPLDGRPTTSTGTATLDGLLAGHAGLALGTSLLVEESGTTDYAGVLLRFYTAEGLVQGHRVHVVGLPEQWGRNLPGLAGSTEGGSSSAAQEKMKIAWRYENLGQFGGGQASRGGHIVSLRSMSVSSLNISVYLCNLPYRFD